MKNEVLIDAGPLIALFDASDRYHSDVIRFLEKFQGVLITTWPVITETLHLLSFSLKARSNFLEWMDRGALTVENLELTDVAYIKERMVKYADIPMDMADASLMCVAEREKIPSILSLDSDFTIYRTLKGKFLKNLLRR